MNTIMIFLNANNAGFSWQDVLFTAIICIAIYVIIRALTNGYYNWKKHECDAKNTAAEKLHKHENDITETKHKIDMEKEMLAYLKKLSEIKYEGEESKVEAFKAAYKDFIAKLELYLGSYTNKNPEEKKS